MNKQIKKTAERMAIIPSFKDAIMKAKVNGLPFELAESRFNSTYDTQDSRMEMMQDFIETTEILINLINIDNRIKILESNNHEFSVLDNKVIMKDYDSSGKYELVNVSDMTLPKLYEFLGY